MISVGKIIVCKIVEDITGVFGLSKEIFNKDLAVDNNYVIKDINGCIVDGCRITFEGDYTLFMTDGYGTFSNTHLYNEPENKQHLFYIEPSSLVNYEENNFYYKKDFVYYVNQEEIIFHLENLSGVGHPLEGITKLPHFKDTSNPTEKELLMLEIVDSKLSEQVNGILKYLERRC